MNLFRGVWFKNVGCSSDARAMPERCPSDTREIGNHPTSAPQNGRAPRSKSARRLGKTPRSETPLLVCASRLISDCKFPIEFRIWAFRRGAVQISCFWVQKFSFLLFSAVGRRWLRFSTFSPRRRAKKLLSPRWDARFPLLSLPPPPFQDAFAV